MRTGRILRFGWAALVAAGAGCAGSRGDVDLLEARLRDQQDLVARYERMFERQSRELSAARREADLLRAQLADQNVAPLLPEHADVLLRAEQLAFHSLLTGMRDLDPEPGHDRLHLLLMPQAHTGEVVRLVGAIEIEALDLSRPEGQQQIARWTFTPEEARACWHAGFLASGFQFELPWEDRTAAEVLLHARLIAPDGRQLDATHSVRVPSALARGKRTTPAAIDSVSLLPVSSSRSRSAPPPPPIVEAPLAPPSLPPPASLSDNSSASTPTAPAFPAPVPTAPAVARPEASLPTAAVDPPPLSNGRELPVPPPAELPIVAPLAPALVQAPETDLPVTSRTDRAADAAARTPNEVTILPLGAPARPRRAADAPERESQPLPPEAQLPQPTGTSGGGGGSPPPFPEVPGLRTSDRWTDESIPYLR